REPLARRGAAPAPARGRLDRAGGRGLRRARALIAWRGASPPILIGGGLGGPFLSPPLGGERAKPVLEPAEPALERRFLRRGLPEAEGLGGEGGDVAADREGGGRRRRGRVEDVDRVGLRDDAEIVHERAVGAHRLCADARAAA